MHLNVSFNIFQLLNTFHMSRLWEQLTEKLQRVRAACKIRLGGVAIICNNVNCSQAHYWLQVIYSFLSLSAPSSMSGRVLSWICHDFKIKKGLVGRMKINTRTEREQILPEQICQTVEYISLNVSIDCQFNKQRIWAQTFRVSMIFLNINDLTEHIWGMSY